MGGSVRAMRCDRLPRAPRRPGILLALLALAVVAGACASDSDSSESSTGNGSSDSVDDPAAGSTAGDSEAPTEDPPMLASDDFADGDVVPVELTCDGANRSPELHWSGVGDESSGLAVVVDDPDAPGGSFIHWTVWNLDSSDTLESGNVPPDAVQGNNDAGSLGWTGPCPPPGDGPHTYAFSLFEVTGPVDAVSGQAPDTVRESIADAGGVEIATLVGVYER